MSRLRRLALAALAAAWACAPATEGGDAGASPTPAAPSPTSVSTASAETETRVLDDFEALRGWSAHPSEGVSLRISQDSGFAGRGMRLDFDFGGGAGYAIARKTLPIRLPRDFDLAFRIRADAPVNDLELKLVDPSGENVWWANRRRFEYPRQWTRLRTPKRRIEFAWGPRGGGEPDSVGAIEIVVTAGTGGKGTVWIDDLTLRTRPPAPADTAPPVARATTADGDAALAVDGRLATAWRGGPRAQSLSLDLGAPREIGGLAIDWLAGAHATRFAVDVSDDGTAWETAYEATRVPGGRSPVPLPETETRHLRVRMLEDAGAGVGVREIRVMPPEWTLTPNAFFAALAKESPRGAYPRGITGEQSYFTVVGVNGDTREGTISADGAVETGLGGPSLEPFLETGGRVLTWADVRAEQALEKGYLPVPTVTWDAAPLRMSVTAFAAGAPEASTVYARYRVENRGAGEARPTLHLALRPFQVNPPWQFLNVQGGVARVRRISLVPDGAVEVDGRRAVVPLTRPERATVLAFDQGNPAERLDEALPASLAVDDPRGYASAVLSYPLRLAAGETREIVVAIPLHDASPVASSPSEAERLRGEAVRGWERALDRFTLRLPPSGEALANTLKSQLAYILINRDGPSIQPGSRSYDRSWIRDGSLTSAALLRLGHPEEVRAFAEWYAPHQRPSGYVPCCVSLRGADPVPEHDSHGQLIYLLAEYHRHTGDTGFLRRMWPHVERAVAYIDTLRHERMTPEYRTEEKRAFYGLVPQSISHEGYSAKPMHSYWDDFFVMKGLDDAVYVAETLGRAGDRARFAAARDSFRVDLLASLRESMARHRIAYLPGSVELGDFDATSTTVAVVPAGLEGALPPGALETTFRRYYRESIRARLDGAAWDGYTPYEWRTVGTFVRMGWKVPAHEAIGLFMAHRRPAAWNHWAEVVFRDPASPRFIGDMPHTWVGSDFIRSVLDLFAYERASDGALVVGAGVPAAWVREAPGVEMDGLRTHFGTLRLAMRAGGDTVRVSLGGGVRVPPGGIVVRTPLDRPIRRATVNGRPVPVSDPGREITVRVAPAAVVLEH